MSVTTGGRILHQDGQSVIKSIDQGLQLQCIGCIGNYLFQHKTREEMKPSNIQAASLLLNLVLICVIAFKLVPKPQSGQTEPTFTSDEQPTALSSGSSSDKPGAGAPSLMEKVSSELDPANESISPKQFHWSQLESPDFRVYIANLRAIGCPDQTIRDIIVSEVNALYMPKIMELTHGSDEYWKHDPWQTSKGEDEKAMEAIQKEKSELLNQLLGHAEHPAASSDNFLGQLSYLPEEKREQVNKLFKDYTEERNEVFAKSKGQILPGDQATLKRIYEKHLEKLSNILSPTELLDWEVRNSPMAKQMRFNLSWFGPNEDEFRKVFSVRKEHGLDEFTQRYPDGSLEDPDMEKAFNESLLRELGPERFQKYARSQDFGYQRLDRLISRTDLPESLVDEVWDMKESITRAKEKILNNENLSDEEKSAAQDEVIKEAESTLKAKLGNEVFEIYKSTGHPIWLR